MPLTAFQQNTNGIVQPSPAGITPMLGPFSTHFTRSDIAFDYAIGGIPFIGGESLRGSYFRRVYQRSFSPIRKDQFDNQQVPGEQSIWGWWLRSQSDFSLGAGLQFLDTTQDSTLAHRYYYSEGLDTLSVPGQVSPVRTTDPFYSGTGPLKLRTVMSSVSPTVADGALILDVGARTVHAQSYGISAVNYSMPGGLTGVANTFTDDGTNYYFADKTGIYKGSIFASGTPATKIWNVPSTSGNYVLSWVKGRLVAGLDNSIYELVGGTPPTLPTPKFTHQNPSYVFTDISETGTAILVSGNAGNSISQIHKFTLDSGGAMPVLTSGIVAATMPYGESILSMYAYIGYFVGIGTNQGFRVGVIDTTGNLTYGPLVVQDANNVGVQAIGGYDRFLFIGNQGNTMIPQQGWVNPPEASTVDMLIRVDMSTLTSTNSQPFANDVNSSPFAANGNPVNSIINIGDKNIVPAITKHTPGLLCWAVGGQSYVTRANNLNGQLTTNGFIYTPKIRFNTLEPKHFKYVYLRHPDIPQSATGIDLYGQNPNSGLQLLAKNIKGSSTLGSSSPFFIQDVGNAQEWFQFKIVPNGRTFNGYQLRGLPGVTRQVIIEIPLLCMDHETDRYGVLSGYDGYAFQRLSALENLTASGNIVLLQDLNYNVSNLVIVDDYKFEQQSPELAKTSSAGNQDSNAHGGYIILQCRVIA